MIKRLLRYLTINICFIASIYYGLFVGIENAANIAFFIAWMFIICSLAYLSDAGIKHMKEKGQCVPATVDNCLDVLITAAFVWYGAWVTGVFYLIHSILVNDAWKRAKKDDDNEQN